MKQMFQPRKYRPYTGVDLADRQWPNRRIEEPPNWCSVDLRDGNQALEVPMNLSQKIRMFNKLIEIGFKEIEVSFPAASDTEFNFTRYLIDNNMIPDDVAIQVLTQSREHIIERTFESIRGARRAIVHLYNSTSSLQRDVVFQVSPAECIDLAVSGARKIRELAEADSGKTDFTFEYSPESFTGTELDFAVEICDAVCDVWQPTTDKKVIINLPATVEMSTPNVYADLIESFIRKTRYRDKIIVSLHTHNDRGTAIAATELGILAGAQRVEGTLFGNGERTGNADLVALAMNLYSQGIDPGLDLSNLDELIEVCEEATQLRIHERHPYAGKLVYTAFSGSHQDAINKGFSAMRNKKDVLWQVPYLPIDPLDVGRSYEPVIRINSQSGKGGVAYILDHFYGFQLPKVVQQAFSARVKQASDHGQRELIPQEIYDLFMSSYVNLTDPLKLIRYQEEMLHESRFRIKATLEKEGREINIEGEGNGLLDAFCKALADHLEIPLEIKSYYEHALEQKSTSQAITYIQIQNGGQRTVVGAGISSNISKSSLRAIVSAVNKILETKAVEVAI